MPCSKSRFYHCCAVAPVWSEWTSWTQCSRSCGFGGTRYRTRFCTTFINRDCGGPSRNTQFFCARPCYSRPPNTVSRPSTYNYSLLLWNSKALTGAPLTLRFLTVAKSVLTQNKFMTNFAHAKIRI